MQSKTLLRALVPSPRLVLLYLCLSIAILFLHTEVLLRELAGVQAVSNAVVPILQENWSLFSDRLNQYELFSTLTLALFWSAVGGIIYIVIWLVGNLFVDVRNKVVEDMYYVNRPSKELKHRDTIIFITRVLFRVSVVLVLLFLTSFFTQVILPFSADMFEVFALASPGTWLNTLLGIVAVMVSLHILVVLFRLLLVCDRVFDR